MQQLGTDPTFVAEQYSDAERLRIRIETHERYSQGDTERLIDDVVLALALGEGMRLLDVGCGAGSWHSRIAQAGTRTVGIDVMQGMLREARSATAHVVPAPLLAQSDAQHLAIADALVDRVLCAGVLYHVADCEVALREMRRVLRPGGIAVISSNGASAMRRIYELHGRAATELGYRPLPITAGHFTMDDTPLVQQVFASVQRHVLTGALVFKTAEPALRFYATNRIDALKDRPPDNSHRPSLLHRMRELIQSEIETKGKFEVPKSTGYFVCS